MQREVVLLLTFSLAAVPLFILTRRAAAWNRQSTLRTAAYWFAQGTQQMSRQESATAIDSFHRAVTNDRDNRQYGMALASALAAAGRAGEARQVLQRWRDASPEDPEINLQLARLSTQSSDPISALRYYHYAIFGVWQDNAIARRIDLRFELAEWLLRRGERGPAVAELIALKAELPDTPAYETRAARLLLQAGDPARALQEFERSLDHDRDDPAALAGAGEACFDLGDYEGARRYLTQVLRADPGSQPAARLLETAEVVLSHDPLAMHLNEDERRLRVGAGLEQAALRLSNCPAAEGAADLQREIGERLEAIRKRSATTKTGMGLELIARAEQSAAASCGPPSGLDQALLLIARIHRVGENRAAAK